MDNREQKEFARALVWMGERLDKGETITPEELHRAFQMVQPYEVQRFFVEHSYMYTECHADARGYILVPHTEYLGTFLPLAQREAERRKTEEKIKQIEIKKYCLDIISIVISVVSLLVAIGVAIWK